MRPTRADLWTADFPDPIVSHPFGYRHRVWIDHILVAPEMLDQQNPVHLVVDSGRIEDRNPVSRHASDHFPVSCDIEAWPRCFQASEGAKSRKISSEQPLDGLLSGQIH